MVLNLYLISRHCCCATHHQHRCHQQTHRRLSKKPECKRRRTPADLTELGFEHPSVQLSSICLPPHALSLSHDRHRRGRPSRQFQRKLEAAASHKQATHLLASSLPRVIRFGRTTASATAASTSNSPVTRQEMRSDSRRHDRHLTGPHPYPIDRRAATGPAHGF